jgi:hypothetical protein
MDDVLQRIEQKIDLIGSRMATTESRFRTVEAALSELAHRKGARAYQLDELVQRITATNLHKELEW